MKERVRVGRKKRDQSAELGAFPDGRFSRELAFPAPSSSESVAPLPSPGHSFGNVNVCDREQSASTALAESPSTGTVIPATLQNRLEESVGASLTGVRLHTDAGSSEFADAMDARAVTIGDQIYFGRGEYQPESAKTQRLLAHEVVHVAQQAQAPDSTSAHIGATPTALEKEAAALAPSVAKGIPVQASAARSIGAAAQPKTDEGTGTDVSAGLLQGGAPANAAGGPTPAIAPPLPAWTSTSSADPLPGDTVPNYDLARDSYSFKDYQAFAIALEHRDQENYEAAVGFLGDYGSAMVDLWATSATEMMAKAADDAGWSALGKVLEFVIKESLIMLSGAGAAVKLGHLGVEIVKLATAAAVDAGFSVAENASERSAVAVKKEEIDAKTKIMAENLKKVAAQVVTIHTGAVPYALWLGQQFDTNFSELRRFRIPPAFPRPDTGLVRASVAQSIVGVLYGDSPFVSATKTEDALWGIFGHYEVTNENVVRIRLGIDDEVSVEASAGLLTSDVLKKELAGHSIAEMPNAPLHITLVSNKQPLDVAKAAMGSAWTLRPGKNIFGGEIEGSWDVIESAQAVVDAYPTRGPLAITRDTEGNVQVAGGGLLEDLYLYQLQNPDKDLKAIIGAIQDEQLAKEERDALQSVDESQGPVPAVNKMVTPEELAAGIAAEILPWATTSAETLVRGDVIASVRLSGV